MDETGKAEEALSPPDCWDLLAKFSPFPMALVDGPGHTMRSVNDAFCRMIGKAESELIGFSFSDCVPKDDRCLEVLERVGRTGESESHTEQEQNEYDREDGQADARSLYWSYSVWSVVRMGAVSTASNREGLQEKLPLGVMIQVTETARLHQQMAEINQALMLCAVRQHGLAEVAAKELEFERRFRFLAESMPQKMFTAKPNGEVDYVNQQWMEYTGLTFGKMRDWGWTQFVHPEDIDENIRSWRYSVETGKPLLLEQRFRGADGSYRWHLSRAHPMRDEHGAVVMWVGTNTDIDDFKRAQETLMRVEKLSTAGRLAASIAHEINNPLEAVTNTLYLARTMEGVPEEARKYLEMADRELMRIGHITRQTLGFYREQSEPSTFFVSTLLSSVVDIMEAKIRSRNVSIELCCDETLEMKGVFGEMRQVFANLLLNSLDAVPENGRVRLRASRSSSAGSIRITVADNGNGIGAGALAHIFEPFFTTKGTIGTGLGLWVSKQIVEKHAGTIQVRSNTAGMRGTVFSVVLPALA